MRIIGGEFRGRKIKQPESADIRPTKDRIREAVFNMIAVSVPGAKILDLFSGSGAYGLEALSRGARKAVFVEKGKEGSEVIKENIRVLGVENKAEVVMADAFGFLEGIQGREEAFDLVFADPPFGKNLAKKTLIKVNHYDILNHSGTLIIEHHEDELLPRSEGDFSVLKEKTYGNIIISIYLKK
jgi:16S rRNA (guanine(966)-N(2))-methyltransferase RsmD